MNVHAAFISSFKFCLSLRFKYHFSLNELCFGLLTLCYLVVLRSINDNHLNLSDKCWSLYNLYSNYLSLRFKL